MASTSNDQAASSSDLLRNARFSSTSGSQDLEAPSATQLLSGAAALHPLAGLNNGELDYLLLDDGKLNDLAGGQTVLPSRGWSDELCYGTGTTYLAGAPIQTHWIVHPLMCDLQAWLPAVSGVFVKDGFALERFPWHPMQLLRTH